ncbi:MAG: thermonuclease family protein [Bacillaceae bacterium]|nr:thermonuclease family protein [Bacillaceae bacterium]
MPIDSVSDDKTHNPKKGTVTAVTDGDTFTLDEKWKVRLIGVDTPEMKGKTEEERMLAQKATDFTKTYLLGSEVRLKYDIEKKDHYGRLLAYVYLDDGTFFNELLLKEGYAQVMTVPPNVTYAEHFLSVQKEARDHNRGLWAIQDLDKPYVDEDGRPLIKGNINSSGEKIYHMPGGRYYDQVKPEKWFKTEREALDAGFRKARE